MPDITFATRVYHDVDRLTRVEFELRDRMVRKADGSFALFVAGELPGDPEIEQDVTLEDVWAWYRECPEQIERKVLT